MFEFILTTLIFEKLRPLFKRKRRNNIKAIKLFSKTSPIYENVGELLKILNNFSDDVPVKGGTFDYGNIQIRDGELYMGSQNYLPENK